MSPRITFEHELEELKENVANMSLQVEKTYRGLFQALEERDADRIRKIMEIDRAISDMERNIESRCLSLLTRQQPVARDLRIVTAGLKVVTDIERAGDHVADMAELFLRLDMNGPENYSEHLLPMAGEAVEMFHDAVEAFVERDEEAARQVIARDDVVDEFFNKVKDDLIECLKKETKNADECVDILLVAKYLEKIADHAVNIGEWELFQETGDIGMARLL
ncbi:MAG: phosphate signaling complex protein PhoU [Lachnospiraceae bacterium]|nr:phosphate signaling complex protein PhoU [Lachnospiraceae bacterium]